MIRRPPGSTRTGTLLPSTTPFRSSFPSPSARGPPGCVAQGSGAGGRCHGRSLGRTETGDGELREAPARAGRGPLRPLWWLVVRPLPRAGAWPSQGSVLHRVRHVRGRGAIVGDPARPLTAPDEGAGQGGGGDRRRGSRRSSRGGRGGRPPGAAGPRAGGGGPADRPAA